MQAEGIKLYTYWRSSAAYRARIALNIKGLEYEQVHVDLSKSGAERSGPEFHGLNPQEMVPVLIHGGRQVRQSLAIIEYLEETFDGQHLLPVTARDRARARGLAQVVACDIHPLNNLRVQQYLERELGVNQAQRENWMRHWIGVGFTALEEMLSSSPSTGDFCEGDMPSIADVCVVPQTYNALRFSVDMKPFPTIWRIYERCMALPEFSDARPENQPDAPNLERIRVVRISAQAAAG